VVVEIEWLLLGAAFGVGLLVGITGVGAGALMTPLLVGVFGVPISIAVATDLIFATITKALGVGFHHRIGHIDWAVARKLWSGSIPGVLVGIGILILAVDRSFAELLTWPLVALVVVTALVLAKRALNGNTPEREMLTVYTTPSRRTQSITGIGGGFGIGIAVALTSVGAGALGMALLVKLSPPNTKPQHLVGTDLVHAIPIALIAGIAYGSAGLVSWGLLASLLLGSLPGVVIGSLISGKVPARPMNALLAVVLLSAALLVAFK
jgi:uncharacterized membrane protein YfcA